MHVYIWPSSLLRISVSTDIEMSSCDVCSMSFERRDNMLRHKRNTHADNELDDQSDSISDSDDSMDDDV